MEKITNITIRKSKRKSVGIQCLKDGKLVIRAPLSMSKREIMGIVEDKSAWIEKARRQLDEQRQLEESISLADNSCFLFMGEKFTVRRSTSAYPAVFVDKEKGQLEIAAVDDESARKAVLFFINKSAKTYLIERTDKMAASMKLSYNTIRIKNQKTRWGSCSSQHNLNLNARIMLAPPQVIDYLIVHELSHLVHMDHSKAFYKLVERYAPDYRIHQGWLRNHAYLLYWGRN